MLPASNEHISLSIQTHPVAEVDEATIVSRLRGNPLHLYGNPLQGLQVEHVEVIEPEVVAPAASKDIHLATNHHTGMVTSAGTEWGHSCRYGTEYYYRPGLTSESVECLLLRPKSIPGKLNYKETKCFKN